MRAKRNWPIGRAKTLVIITPKCLKSCKTAVNWPSLPVFIAVCALAKPAEASRQARTARETGYLFQSLNQVVANAQGIGHGRKRRINSPDTGEKAGVYHVKVVQFMGFAECVKH